MRKTFFLKKEIVKDYLTEIWCCRCWRHTDTYAHIITWESISPLCREIMSHFKEKFTYWWKVCHYLITFMWKVRWGFFIPKQCCSIILNSWSRWGLVWKHKWTTKSSLRNPHDPKVIWKDIIFILIYPRQKGCTLTSQTSRRILCSTHHFPSHFITSALVTSSSVISNIFFLFILINFIGDNMEPLCALWESRR